MPQSKLLVKANQTIIMDVQTNTTGTTNTFNSNGTVIDLINGCSEEGCIVETDDAFLSDVIRKHFLLNFGHRRMDLMKSDYTEDAVMLQVIDGKQRMSRGIDQIASEFVAIFDLHTVGKSTFRLEHVMVNGRDRHGMAVWTATIPGATLSHATDSFVFNEEGKILSQTFVCNSTKSPPVQ